VTRDQYAALLAEEKVRLAAGIQPCRLTDTERSNPRDPSVTTGRKVAVNFSMTPELTTENQWAPELGLEPRTTRLTEVPDEQDSDGLGHDQDNPWTGLADAQAAARKLLSAAAAGQPLTAIALQLAGQIIEASERTKRPAKVLKLVRPADEKAARPRKVSPFNPV
jgi:hypothetical protein